MQDGILPFTKNMPFGYSFYYLNNEDKRERDLKITGKTPDTSKDCL